MKQKMVHIFGFDIDIIVYSNCLHEVLPHLIDLSLCILNVFNFIMLFIFFFHLSFVKSCIRKCLNTCTCIYFQIVKLYNPIFYFISINLFIANNVFKYSRHNMFKRQSVVLVIDFVLKAVSCEDID